METNIKRETIINDHVAIDQHQNIKVTIKFSDYDSLSNTTIDLVNIINTCISSEWDTKGFCTDSLFLLRDLLEAQKAVGNSFVEKIFRLEKEAA